jgi:uncharacterized protein involved in propanediol utilization
MPTRDSEITVVSRIDAPRAKTVRAIRAALEWLESRYRGGRLALHSNIADGRGFGSSTADVVAAIRAVAAANETSVSSEVIARLAIEAEIASDPTMFAPSLVLFAQREAQILERLACSVPAFEVLGVDADPAGPEVDTLRHPLPRYDEIERNQFAQLRERLRAGLESRDLQQIASVASASSVINERYLPKRHFASIRQIAHDVGALGIQVAHSGSIMGLLFDPRDAFLERRLSGAAQQLCALGLSSTRRQLGAR